MSNIQKKPDKTGFLSGFSIIQLFRYVPDQYVTSLATNYNLIRLISNLSRLVVPNLRS